MDQAIGGWRRAACQMSGQGRGQVANVAGVVLAGGLDPQAHDEDCEACGAVRRWPKFRQVRPQG